MPFSFFLSGMKLSPFAQAWDRHKDPWLELLPRVPGALNLSTTEELCFKHQTCDCVLTFSGFEFISILLILRVFLCRVSSYEINNVFFVYFVKYLVSSIGLCRFFQGSNTWGLKDLTDGYKPLKSIPTGPGNKCCVSLDHKTRSYKLRSII